MISRRVLLGAALVVLALLLQVTVLAHVSFQGVVSNLCLLVVVGAALTRGADFASLLGFGAGLLLDLAPPADHLVGRWALALMLVGYLAGRVRQDVRPTVPAVVATVAAASFVGTSVFALSGLLLGDGGLAVGGLLQVIGIALVTDVVATPFVLPLVMTAFTRIEPERDRVAA